MDDSQTTGLGSTAGIIFDLDGTLVDSTYVHTVCWWEAVRQYGHVRPMAVLNHAVGMGADHLLDHVLGPERDRHQDAAITAAHDALFATWHERLHPFAAARSLLAWCRDVGLTVALATSGGREALWAMLDVLDHPDLDVVVTGDDVTSTKPSHQLLSVAVDRMHLEPVEILVVGDSVWDMESAGLIGAPAIGVATGGTCSTELAAAGAAMTFPDLGAFQHTLQTALRAEVGASHAHGRA